MRRVALLPILAVVAACSDGPVTGPQPAPTDPAFGRGSAPRGEAKTRPLIGGCTTVFTALPPVANQPPNVQRLQIDSDCRFKGIGRTRGSTEQTVTFGPSGITIVNTTTYTAPNGDRLFATFTGTATPPDAAGTLCFSGTETFTGGTGRFEGASGTAQVTGCASVIEGRGSFVTRGSIVLPRSKGGHDDDSDTDSDG